MLCMCVCVGGMGTTGTSKVAAEGVSQAEVALTHSETSLVVSDEMEWGIPGLVQCSRSSVISCYCSSPKYMLEYFGFWLESSQQYLHVPTCTASHLIPTCPTVPMSRRAWVGSFCAAPVPQVEAGDLGHKLALLMAQVWVSAQSLHPRFMNSNLLSPFLVCYSADMLKFD